MSYIRHQAVDLSAASTHSFASLPTTEDLLLTGRGTCSGSGAQNWFTLRPNNNANSAQYGSVTGNFYSSGPGSGGNSSDKWWLGAWGASFPLVQFAYRITKSGDYWLINGHALEGATPTAVPLMRYNGGVWDSLGLILSSLRFDTNLGNSALRMSGRLELWYQDA